MRTFRLLLTNSCLPAADEQYQSLIAGREERLIGFVRAFESFQEELQMADVPRQRKTLSSKVGTSLPELQAELAEVSTPSKLAAFDAG